MHEGLWIPFPFLGSPISHRRKINHQFMFQTVSSVLFFLFYTHIFIIFNFFYFFIYFFFFHFFPPLLLKKTTTSKPSFILTSTVYTLAPYIYFLDHLQFYITKRTLSASLVSSSSFHSLNFCLYNPSFPPWLWKVSSQNNLVSHHVPCQLCCLFSNY